MEKRIEINCKKLSYTLRYMAPEIYYEREPSMYHSDIYSIGVMFLRFFDPSFLDFNLRNVNYDDYLIYLKNYKFPELPKEMEILKRMIMKQEEMSFEKFLNPFLRPNAKTVLEDLNKIEDIVIDIKDEEKEYKSPDNLDYDYVTL